MSRSQQEAEFQRSYGPWAVVTGASEGIGKEFARCLARAGLNLVLVSRRQEALDEIAQAFSRDSKIQTKIVAADLSQSAGCSAVIEATRDLEVGLLVACAGYGTAGPLCDSDIAEQVNMLDVNCRAVLVLAHQFGRRFAARGRGGMVLMSSLLAFQGTPFAANYAATKSYIQSLAEGLRAELAPAGVDVIASAPGPIHSGFAARAHMKLGLGQTPDVVAQATLDALGSRTTVRPGWLSKFLWYSMALLPRNGRVRIMKRIMGGMSLRRLGHEATRA